MKGGIEKTVIAVCSGQGEYGTLSETGIAQMETLRAHVNTVILREYKTTEVRRLLVDFSDLHVALASVHKLRKKGEPLLVMAPPSFKKTKKVLKKEHVLEELVFLNGAFQEMTGLASHWNASVIVIVAQGAVSVVLAEIAYEKFTRRTKDLGEGLESGVGLCIIPRAGSSPSVVSISSGGIIPLSV